MTSDIVFIKYLYLSESEIQEKKPFGHLMKYFKSIK